VSELVTHLRKDIRMHMLDPMFIILLVILCGAALIVALASCAGYINSIGYGRDIVTAASLQMQQRLVLANYWNSIAGIYMIVFTVIASLALAGEKESGMVKYILTHRTSKLWFYISKFLILLGVVAIAMVIALVAYFVVFSVMDVPLLDVGILAKSMIFPLLIALVFSALGLTISALSKKRSGAVVASVAVFVLLTFLSPVSIYLGMDAAHEVNPDANLQNVVDFIPLEYKLLIYANPLVLSYGLPMIMDVYTNTYHDLPQLYSLEEGAALGLFMVLTWFVIGLIGFSRERMDKGWFTRIRGRLKS